MRIKLFEEYSEVLYSIMPVLDWIAKVYDPMKGMMGNSYEIDTFTDSEKDLMKKALEDIAKATIGFRVSFGAKDNRYCTEFNLSSIGMNGTYYYFGNISIYKHKDEWFYVSLNLPYKYMTEIYKDRVVAYQYKCDTIDGVLSLFSDILKSINKNNI